MLSYNIHECAEVDGKDNDNVLRAFKVQTASGYIINEHYYDTLITLYEYAYPLLMTTKQHWIYANDVIWYECQKRDVWYLFSIRMGKQRHGYSDNSQQYLELDC